MLSRDLLWNGGESLGARGAGFCFSNRGARLPAFTALGVGRAALGLLSLGRVEQLGDFGDGGGAGVDVAHHGSGRAVSGLGHDQLKRDLLLAEVCRAEWRSWCSRQPV